MNINKYRYWLASFLVATIMLSVPVFWITNGYIKYLPSGCFSLVIRYKIDRHLDSRTFPSHLLIFLDKNQDFIKPDLYPSILKLWVYSQDKDRKNMESLIRKINENGLFCSKIPNFGSVDSPTESSGLLVKDALRFGDIDCF